MLSPVLWRLLASPLEEPGLVRPRRDRPHNTHTYSKEKKAEEQSSGLSDRREKKYGKIPAATFLLLVCRIGPDPREYLVALLPFPFPLFSAFYPSPPSGT